MHNLEKIEKKKEQRNLFDKKIFFFLLFSIFYSLNANAQCAMCRASLESNGDTSQAEAVNDGIVYLMAIPYILVAVIGIFIYRMYYAKK
ncbi:hypothetical protein [Flavobacterium capsici]|uniref:Uncharacterized protein n=1 Tax=Flavobacterium capsici TaxID=3075618 RepID=A0AA96EYY8_9FLAO|nr:MULTISPECIES: hypothetical protein [unclassified Flavobacterium]WNM19333.1 hypothetical protein RN608_01300 [Flavobacterium sp. PMR2A8]WNM20722.1 hypothetical protein RN605_08470 [Flavobacterium sp. PMTSA4]